MGSILCLARGGAQRSTSVAASFRPDAVVTFTPMRYFFFSGKKNQPASGQSEVFMLPDCTAHSNRMFDQNNREMDREEETKMNQMRSWKDREGCYYPTKKKKTHPFDPQ